VNRRNYLTLAAWAVGAFGLTLFLMAPSRLDAVGPNDSPGGYMSASNRPTNGVLFVLQTTNGITAGTAQRMLLKPDAPLDLQVVVTNTLRQSVEIPTTMIITTTGAMSPMSRSLPIQREIWRTEGTIALGPHEVRTIRLYPRFALEPGSNIYVTLQANGRICQRLTLSVERAAPARVPANTARVYVAPRAPSNVPLPPPPAVEVVNGQKLAAGAVMTFDTGNSPASAPIPPQTQPQPQSFAAPTTGPSAGTVLVPVGTRLEFN
jgi:hypothetical protein